MKEVLTIAQITDCHLLVDPLQQHRGVLPEERFDKVISSLTDKVESIGKFDYLLLTGDLAQQPKVEVYQRILDKSAHLAKRVHWLPGNHDDAQLMAQFDGVHQKLIETEHWLLVLLDSTANPDGVGGGSLADTELAIIESLQSLTEKHLFIALHHPPIAVGSAWQDAIKLANAEVFWQKVAPLTNLRGVTFGHLHQEHHIKQRGLELFGTPATTLQFKKAQKQFCLEDDEKLSSPGYRVFSLSDDGSISSHVTRLAG